MAIDIIELLKLCFIVENEHLKWFAWMLYDHFDGIIAYATYRISSGMIEGINNKIKTLWRQAYGYPDDEYFFLKLFDLSRSDYTRNAKSHKVCDWALKFQLGK